MFDTIVSRGRAGKLSIACIALSLSAVSAGAQSSGPTEEAPLAKANAYLMLPYAPEPEQQQSKPVPQPPSSSTPPAGAPTLDDLGVTPEQAHGDDRTQALLDKRSHMLKVHQRLGLITALPILAACISGGGATPDRGTYGSTTSRDIHVGIAGLAIGMYGATAYYAAAAPSVGKAPARGGVKLHKYLIYIHAPGMVLTPILGAMAFNQANSGQQVHGIASAHSAVAATTAVAYGASILAVTYPIHLHFHRTAPAQNAAVADDAQPPVLLPRETK